jgi:hypothetical protein
LFSAFPLFTDTFEYSASATAAATALETISTWWLWKLMY